jgi:DNA-binding NtrC family response regulator
VFLDEAGEMSTRMQGVLLRFLETGEVQRVGSERAARRVNVRIIAATNRDLSQQIAAGAFREDLYYRLNVIRMHVPPLRERLDDVAELFDHFMAVFGRQYRVEPRALTPEADAVLRRHRWPGNVRELKNVVEQLVVKDRGQPVLAADLPSEYRDAGGVLSFSPGAQRGDDDRWSTEQLVRRMTEGGESFWSVLHGPFMARDLSRDQLRHVIRAGLEQTGGNYRVLVELFNMPATDYKRFLGFLRKHDCQVPFHPFRSVRHRRGGLGEPQVVFPSAASM